MFAAADILINFFEYTGLSPFTFKQKKSYQTFSTIISTTISLLAITINFLIGTESYEITKNNSLAELSGVLVYFLFTFNAIIIILESFLKRQNYHLMYKSFLNINHFYQVNLPIHLLKQTKNLYIIKTITILLLFLFLKIIFLFQLDLNELNETTLYWLLSTYPMILIRLRCVQCMFYVNWLHDQLNLLHNQMECILNDIDRNKKFFAGHEQQYNIDRRRRRIKTSSNEQLLLLKRINFMKIIYGKLWKIIVLYNDTFGISLLIVTIQTLIDLVIYPYWIMAGIENLIPSRIIQDSIMLLFSSVMLAVVLFFICDNCAKKAQIISNCARKLLLKYNHVIDGDDKILLCQEFVLQTIHQPFDVSANGIFYVNLSLLVSVCIYIFLNLYMFFNLYLFIYLFISFSSKKKGLGINGYISGHTDSNSTK